MRTLPSCRCDHGALPFSLRLEGCDLTGTTFISQAQSCLFEERALESAPMKRFDQYCPMAHALSLVGERWSLLVVGSSCTARSAIGSGARPPWNRHNILVPPHDLESVGVIQKRSSAADARDRLRADGVRQGVERGVVCVARWARGRSARRRTTTSSTRSGASTHCRPLQPGGGPRLTETYVLKIDDDVFTARIVDGALAEAAWRCRGRGSRARDGHADVLPACPRRPRAAGRGGERLCPDRQAISRR